MLKLNSFSLVSIGTLFLSSVLLLVSGKPYKTNHTNTSQHALSPVALANYTTSDQNVSVETLSCSTIDTLYDYSQNGTSVTTRNGIINPSRRWTYFHILPDVAFERWEIDTISRAVSNLRQALPCIEMMVHPQGTSPTGDFVRLVKGTNNGCNSPVGKSPGGRQSVNLQSPGCINVGTIMHELIHSLGFHHEHNRPDRDDYVNILWDNIASGRQINFDKLSSRSWSTYGADYNYRSIMHYNSMGFSRNGQPTMVAKNGQIIGRTNALQDTDIQKLRALYNC